MSVSSRHVSFWGAFWGDNQKKKREKSSCKVNFEATTLRTSKKKYESRFRHEYGKQRAENEFRIYLSPHTNTRKEKEKNR